MPGTDLNSPQAPGAQENPLLPAGALEPLKFEQFRGMDTSVTRPAVDDKQCAWLDGFMPLGPMSARTIYGIGTALYKAGTPGSIVSFYFVSLNTVAYCLVFISDGSIVAVNTVSKVATTIAPSGTISDPAIFSIGVAQWGANYALIVSVGTNGYIAWDGHTLYKPTAIAPQLSILDVGQAYSSAPTITVTGGGGSLASLVALESAGQVYSVSIVNPGIDYTLPPTITFIGGGITMASASAYIGGASSGVASISLSYTGVGYSDAPDVSFVGGVGGSGAAAAAFLFGNSLATVSVTSPGSGYLVAPTVVFTGGGPANATVGIMPTGISGTAIETYSGRVWIAFSNEITFSAPGSISDFSSGDGGGSFFSTDSFLRNAYVGLRQTNGFLYLFGDSSINYISNVQTSGNPPATTFTNQNADPEVGTPYPASIDTYGRNLIFANAWGVHVSYGAAVTKVSKPLDGVYNSALNFNGLSLSSAKAIIFGRKVWTLLAIIVDPITGQDTAKLLMWDGEVWWASNQEISLIYIAGQEVQSQLTAYGTDGTTIFPLFQTPSDGFTKVAQSKLWTVPMGASYLKTTSRFWGMVQYYETGGTLSISVDSEAGSYAFSPTPLISAGVPITVFAPQAIEQSGVLLGLTLTTTVPDAALISLAIDVQPYGYRG
jgi:hypothetical protein